MKVKMGQPSHKGQSTKINIDDWDTWDMDVTLAKIIHPMLIQLKKQNDATPTVHNQDVPAKLRKTDENSMDRWNWVLDEIIYAFSRCKTGEDTPDPREANGLRLFGVYYRALWT